MIKQSFHIAAPLSDEIRDKAASLIQRVQYDGPAQRHLPLMLDVIADMTESSLDFFFMLPLRKVNAGSMTMTVAQMGLQSTQKGMSLVIRKVLKRLDDNQLNTITGFIEEILFEPEAQSA